MKISRNRAKAATIALVLMLTITATFITCMPAVNAATYPTAAFIAASPNPVGVGQYVLVVFWLSYPSPTAVAYYDPLFNWNGYLVTITKPGGTTETKGPYTSDATGSRYFSYVPDTVGQYKFVFSFPGQWINTTTFNNYYQPSTSNEFVLTVQQQPVSALPEIPSPTGYWTRPINAENRGWASISGDWPMGGCNTTRNWSGAFDSGVAFNPYTTMPKTPHIVWTKPLGQGGSVGGMFNGVPYYTGSSYRRELMPPVIINGKLYYTYQDSGAGMGPGARGTYCVDLRTGETIWWKNYTITLGQILNMVNQNEAGCMAYLWDTTLTTWYRYDAFSGDLITTLTDALPGANTGINVRFDTYGNLVFYIMNGNPGTQNWLAMWNSSLAAPTGTFVGWGSGTFPWKNGIQWNITIPRGGLSPGAINAVQWTSPDVLIGGNMSLFAATTGGSWDVAFEGYSAKDGHLLWNQTWPNLVQLGGYHIAIVTDEIFYIYDQMHMQLIAFNKYTGQKAWTSDAKTNPWGTYTVGMFGGYGKVYSVGLDGMVYAFNLKTGETVWTWGPRNSGTETFYANYPLYSSPVIAGGALLVSDGEHGHGAYTWRGSKMHAIDAASGQTLWGILGYYHQASVADGYIIAPNGYDGNIYCFGKGQTATTVSSTPGVVANGSSVLIQGTITDQSPGAAGTPCVSDKSQEGWMEYLYEQQLQPSNATGVPVLLQAMSSDGKVTDLATVTSDIMGHFEYLWKPPTTGTYKILATFLGSEAYWMSSAQTALGVTPAPAAPPPVEIPAYPDYTPMLAAILVAVVIAIIIGIVIILRKK